MIKKVVSGLARRAGAFSFSREGRIASERFGLIKGHSLESEYEVDVGGCRSCVRW